MEPQILELKKIPPEMRTGEAIVNWMWFLNGKQKEDFAYMAKTDKRKTGFKKSDSGNVKLPLLFFCTSGRHIF